MFTFEASDEEKEWNENGTIGKEKEREKNRNREKEREKMMVSWSVNTRRI